MSEKAFGATASLGRLLPATWRIDAPLTVAHERQGRELEFLERSDVVADRIPGVRDLGAEETRVAFALRRVPEEGGAAGASMRLEWRRSAVDALTSREEATGITGAIRYDAEPAERSVDAVPGVVESLLRALLPRAIEESRAFSRLADARVRWSPERVGVSGAFESRTARTWRYEGLVPSPTDPAAAAVVSPREEVEGGAHVAFRPFTALSAALGVTTTRDLPRPRPGYDEPGGPRGAGGRKDPDRRRRRGVGEAPRRDHPRRLPPRPRAVAPPRRGVRRRLPDRPLAGVPNRPRRRRRYDPNPPAGRPRRAACLRLPRPRPGWPCPGARRGVGRVRDRRDDRRRMERRARLALRPRELRPHAWAPARARRARRVPRRRRGHGGFRRRPRRPPRPRRAPPAGPWSPRGRVGGGNGRPLRPLRRRPRPRTQDVAGRAGDMGRGPRPDRAPWRPRVGDRLRRIPGEHVDRAVRRDRPARHRMEGPGPALPRPRRRGEDLGYTGHLQGGEHRDATGAAQTSVARHDLRLDAAFAAPRAFRATFPAPIRASAAWSLRTERQCRVPASGEEPCTPYVDRVDRQADVLLETVVSWLNVGVQIAWEERVSWIGTRPEHRGVRLRIFGEFNVAAGTFGAR